MLLWYEVGNGGFLQYFGNPAGDHAQKTVEDLLAIGAGETAAVLVKAIDVFGPQGPSADRSRRQGQLRGLGPDAVAELDECDQFVFDDPEDLEGLLESFVRSHGADAQ